jgi:hypothetical protein
MTIVNARGINGSGKTTLARAVLAHLAATTHGPQYVNKAGRTRQWPLHLCDTPVGRVVVHGRYDVQQGGCDTENDMDAVEAGLRYGFSHFPGDHHFFEGFIVSKSSKRFTALAEDHRPMGWHCVVLDPGLDECVRRVMSRNGGKEPKRHHMKNSLEGDVLRCRDDFTRLGWCRVSTFESVSADEVWGLF